LSAGVIVAIVLGSLAFVVLVVVVIWKRKELKAKFFRDLSATFPSLLDVLCCTDPAQSGRIRQLQHEIQFMCLCVLQTQSKTLHLSLREWYRHCLCVHC
jgi:hypothetical protein